MNYVFVCRIVGSVLLVIVAIIIGMGGKALWNGRPSDWPDLTATDAVVMTSSRWALVIAVALTACAVSTFMKASWGFTIAAVALVILLVILFWGHFVLFGTWDAKRAAMNVVIVGVILALLRVGYSGA